jgi:uncharacterized protein
MPAPASLSDLSGLPFDEIVARAQAIQNPPVTDWKPGQFSHSKMRIARNGDWFHDGGRIERPAMLRLFASILRREHDGQYALVTPVEHQIVDVEDLPFIAVEMRVDGVGKDARIAFRLNTGDVVIAGPDHPLSLAQMDEEPDFRIMVRRGLAARIGRAPYYDLVELAMALSDLPGVWSNGTFFPLEMAA